MYRSLFFKEWIKTRRLVWLLAIVFAGVTGYIFLNISKLIQAGVIPLWGSIIENNLMLVSLIKFFPGAAGLLFAIVQFAPEMQSKRLKLTLHLPLNESKNLCAMLGYGVVVLSLLFMITCLILLGGISASFSSEIVMANFLKMLPWLLAGYATYLLGAWISFEPVWMQRVLNALPAVALVSFFYMEGPSGAYTPFLPFLIVMVVAVFAFSFVSVTRFKNGVQ
ncbi:hypothetical protein [Proteiniphilum sp.]|uniref:hypothetical protein n=1 Tax=Proteiniphilum sp. TaxID=1926877 RepID=UPI002B21F4BD|nr:hypothetical protein [Proteiniphilum sp.]MEA4916139.1 hypothetical protein [Proteiniphilum sp.]